MDYHQAFVGQRTTPLQVLEAALAAIDEQPPDLRVFASLADRGALRREAEESGRRYAAGRALSEFDGVPVAVKDMVRVAGLNCTFGTHPSFGTGPDTQDDIVVARLRQKGAIVLGLTVMTEHGTSPLGYSVHSRAPVNPYSRRHYSGGSSSGSGVGVALGLFPVSLGFDGGGSIRIPSAMCGIVGLKCTWGRVPIDGSVCCQVNVAPGPMAASAVDAALFYQVIGSAARDHYYQRLYGGAEPPPAHCSGIGRIEDLGDLRLGVFWEWFEDCQPEVLSLVREALRFLQSRGAQVVSVKIPHLEVLSLAHAVSISADFTTQHEHQAFDAPWTLEPATTIQLAIGSAWSGVEVKSADWFRAWMCDFLQRLFDEQQLSGLFMPTMACLPPELPAAARDTGESNTSLVMQLMKFIGLANFCGLPAVSMPVGLSPGGLPVGAQLVARHWDEHICLRVANALDVDQFRSVPPGHVDLLARAGAAGQASC
ncbi:unnamed protein product [Prorocentrum cordatum]|uniref:Amidase domain-containing protein n=1 Tax=Prorocentrum cordatum TaxID=2364126 RepID=A0ABN9TAG0_9DINO|nr:unnamed protein product [Polarella glacialis]